MKFLKYIFLLIFILSVLISSVSCSDNFDQVDNGQNNGDENNGNNGENEQEDEQLSYSVKVIDEEGVVSPVVVKIYNSQDEQVATGITNSDGSTSFELVSGTYYVKIAELPLTHQEQNEGAKYYFESTRYLEITVSKLEYPGYSGGPGVTLPPMELD